MMVLSQQTWGTGLVGLVMALLMVCSATYADIAPLPPPGPKSPKTPIIRPVLLKEVPQPAPGSNTVQPGKGFLATATLHYDAITGIFMILLMSGMLWHRYSRLDSRPTWQLTE